MLQDQDIGDSEASPSQSLSETCIVGASAQEATNDESSSETETCLLDVLLEGTPSQSGNGRHSSCTGLKIDHVAPRTMEQEALTKAYGAWPACLTSWACLMFRNALASQPLWSLLSTSRSRAVLFVVNAKLITYVPFNNATFMQATTQRRERPSHS